MNKSKDDSLENNSSEERITFTASSRREEDTADERATARRAFAQK